MVHTSDAETGLLISGLRGFFAYINPKFYMLFFIALLKLGDHRMA